MSDEIGGVDEEDECDEIADTNHINSEEGNGNDTTVVSISTSSTRQTSHEPNDTSFVLVKVPTEEWKRRLQDGGCAKSALKKKTYQKTRYQVTVLWNVPFFITTSPWTRCTMQGRRKVQRFGGHTLFSFLYVRKLEDTYVL